MPEVGARLRAPALMDGRTDGRTGLRRPGSPFSAFLAFSAAPRGLERPAPLLDRVRALRNGHIQQSQKTWGAKTDRPALSVHIQGIEEACRASAFVSSCFCFIGSILMHCSSDVPPQRPPVLAPWERGWPEHHHPLDDF